MIEKGWSSAAQGGPVVGRGLLVGVDEQDALPALRESVGDVQRQGCLAGAAFLVEEGEYGHGMGGGSCSKWS